MNSLGNHLIVDLYDCPASLLDDIEFVKKSLLEIARESGATVLNSVFHHFRPQGITGLIAIAESHIAIHTWPEYNYATIDIFSCGDKLDYDKCSTLLKQTFQAQKYTIENLQRGKLNSIKDFLINNSL